MPSEVPPDPHAACAPAEASASLLDTGGFVPRWSCGSWDAGLGWVHIGSDVATGLAYTAIPILLLVLVRRRRADVPVPGLLYLFTAFILACGTGHFLEAAIFWWPAYRLSAVIKLVTALVSVVTVYWLARVLPALLELRSSRELEREVLDRTAELRASQTELVEARRSAEATDMAKSGFLATMSHELRTPLAAILGSLDLLLDDHGLDEAARTERLQAVRRNAEHQLGLIENVLDFSRVQAGSVELDLQPTCPVRIAHEAIELVEPKAAQRGLEIDLDARASNVVFVTDPLRLRQVLINLLSNAIKFTERGGIAVSVRSEVRGGTASVVYVVRDTGIGMTAAQLERVFVPYRQAEASTHARYGGTGLGLAISRKLAECLGGTLVASSSLGKGSTFELVVRGPVAEAPLVPRVEPHPPLPARRSPLAGARVLLAEDQPDLALVTRRQLELAGCRVVVAPDGAAALRAFAEREFDLVLLDLQMPEIGGVEVARRMRGSGWKRPIVALTANVFAETREQCLGGGFDDYVTKPVRREELVSLLARLVRASALAAE